LDIFRQIQVAKIMTIVHRSNFITCDDGKIVIKSFNGPADLLVLNPVDQVDTTQFDGSWTSPYWPVLKAKYDLEMPGEPSGNPPAPQNPPSGGGGGSQNTPSPDPGP